MNKRGQATLFVIVGILIVILVGLGIFYRSEIAGIFQSANIEQEGIFGENTRIVETFITQCLNEEAQAGVGLIGSQGGYINIPEDELTIDGINFLSNALVVLPGLYVPYWYYETGNGIQKSEIPTVNFMQKELEDYLKERLPVCINNFEVFGESLDIAQGELTPEVTIDKKSVEVVLNYPVTVKQENNTARFTRFQTTVDEPLGELYANAREIMEKENEETFLEKRTLDLFVVYDEIPFSGLDFECSPKIWEKNTVQRDIKEIVSSNIAHIKVKGSNYETDDEYLEVEGINIDSDKSVQFSYSQDWPLLMDITPDDQILRGESYNDNELGKFVTQFFCLNYYNFVYDLKYPILVSITDDETGYVFQFANQVIIDNNQERQSAITQEITLGREDRTCENPIGKLTVLTQGYAENGRIVNVDNAKVKIHCVGATCNVGDSINGQFSGAVPQCLNARVEIESEEYYPTSDIVSTVQEDTITLVMEPKKELELDVRLIREEQGTDRGLIQGEIILIQFINQENGFSTSTIYPDQTTITLIPGDYEIRTTVLRNGNQGFSIKGETIESCVEVPRSGVLGFIGLTENKCADVELEGTTLDSVIVGGATDTFRLSRGELLTNNKITIYTIRNEEPETITDLQEVYKKISENNQNPAFKEPTLE